MDHIDIDVHKRESQIYILAEEGEIIEQRIRGEGERFAVVLRARARARILIEASTDSEWVVRCLEALGDEVIIADPNFAPMYATRKGLQVRWWAGTGLNRRHQDFQSCSPGRASACNCLMWNERVTTASCAGVCWNDQECA